MIQKRETMVCALEKKTAWWFIIITVTIMIRRKTMVCGPEKITLSPLESVSLWNHLVPPDR